MLIGQMDNQYIQPSFVLAIDGNRASRTRDHLLRFECLIRSLSFDAKSK